MRAKAGQCGVRNMNVLVVTAHHDDLELGCGGTIAKLHDGANRLISLVLTNSEYRGPDKTIIRTKEAALKEGRGISLSDSRLRIDEL